jgi:vacuolar-type H+-ATPase subunit H
MTIDEAKKEIKKLRDFICSLSEYVPETYEQNAIKLYVEFESVTQVALLLNDMDYRIGSRKVIGKDVSDLIRSKAADEMHELAQKIFKANSKRARGRGWL